MSKNTSLPASNSSSLSSHAYTQNLPASDPTLSSRFNSFSLPGYRNQHGFPDTLPAGSSVAPPSTVLATQSLHASFQQVSEPESRHHSISSGPSVYTSHQPPQQPQQQRAPQLLSTASITTSSGSHVGSAEPTGGGGGSGGAGLSLSLGQVHLLLATTNERNYEVKRNEILKLTESMEVNTRVLQKLITDNYTYILSPSGGRGQDYRVLADIIKGVASAPHKAKTMFADVITPDVSANVESAKVFKDFNLAAFLSHFQLDALQRSILSVGFKTHPKEDLRIKAHDVLKRAFPSMLELLANPAKHPGLTPEGIAFFLRQLLSEPLPSFLDESESLRLSYAARSRYSHTSLPPEIFNITEPVEHMRQTTSLVQALHQFGPQSISTLSSCRELLKRKWHVQLTASEVADVLVYMATSENPGSWNSNNLIEAMMLEGNLAQGFDWKLVIQSLDREDFVLEQPEGLHVVLRAIQQGAKDQEFQIDRLWGGRWRHPRAQWSVLRAYLKSEDVDVNKMMGVRKVFTSEDFSNGTAAIKMLAAAFETNKLISLAAVDALLYLALDEAVPPDIHIAASPELDKGAKYAPELLLCGAIMTTEAWPPPLESVVDALFNTFFEGHTSHQLVFWRLWQVDKATVTKYFVRYHQHNPLTITRILDISQDLRCLGDLLDVQNSTFVLDVASLAARREYLNLDKWLVEMINKYGLEFAVECYQFLRVKAEAEYAQTREGKKTMMVNLRVGPVNSFLTVLDNNPFPQSGMIQDHITLTQRLCIQAYPRLINLGAGLDHVILQNNAESNTFPPDIDKNMQQHYKLLYAQEMEVRELVTELEKLKYSHVPKEQDLFSCMIHGLFDEYQCYPDYPLQALATTSVLFGSVIRYKLIDGIPLRAALAMVWQAVRDSAPDSSMYKFGLQALMQFSSRLPEWKTYCQLLINVQGLQNTEIWATAQDVVMGKFERSIDGSVNGSIDHDSVRGLPNGSSKSPVPIPLPAFRALHADPPLKNSYVYEDPDEEVQDKVLFIVNNLSHSNLENKLKELQQWLQEPHHLWFADYLVVTRAKLEPNYQPLYLDLLEGIGHSSLMAEVLRETYVHIIALLNAESTLNNSTERAHLKNLGLWLGGLTIAKDKPIKFKNISFRDLLIEGWQTDRLIVVLPFTCNVLQQANNSTVFKPPNPWLMAIIKLLKELYDMKTLKLNLKFEIEVLCKRLELNIQEIKPSTLIQEAKEQQEAVKEDPLEEEEASVIAMENLALQHQPDYSPGVDNVLSSLSEQITINAMIRDSELKKLMIETVARTIQEILGPVVERSVTIATISANQLILKDFATEPDENKMRTSAVGMAQRLAGNLALVTCKDPLRMSMVNNIRTALNQAGYTEQSVSEQAVTVVVNDNLEFACRTVEKAAQDQAIPQIDSVLAPHYAFRKRHRASNPLQHFVAPGVSHIAMNLPDAFRLNRGGLTSQQLAVYEEFARPSLNGAVPNVDQARNQVAETLPIEYLAGTPGIMEAPQVDQRVLDVQNLGQHPVPVEHYLEKIFGWVEDMRKSAKESQENRFVHLPDRHRIFQYIDMALAGISQVPNLSKDRDHVCTKTAALLCNHLYTGAQSDIEIESIVFLLGKVCEFSAQTAKDVLMWLAQDKDDEHTFNIPVTVALLHSHLLPVARLDMTLAKHIEARKLTALEFLAQLLKEAQSTDPPLAYRTDFTTSFDAVADWIREDPTNQTALFLWNDLAGEENFDLGERDRRDQIQHIFIEWVQLCQNISTTDKNYSAFIIQLHQGNILSELESCAEFFRICIDFCISDYETTRHTGASIATNCYIYIDALAKMVMLLVKYQADHIGDRQYDRVEYLDGLLALVVFVFNHHYETRKETFCERVFFRFFSSLLYEFHVVEHQLAEYSERILGTFAECFMVLQPIFFPMFTFHWATLVSHRYFMSKLLHTEKGQTTFLELLETYLSYIGTTLRSQPAQGAVKILYRGSLRLLLVLHHDFPEFLAQNYQSICEVIPVHCTQLRNLILSALPQSAQDLPDPFSNVQIKILPESNVLPVIRGDVTGALRRHGIKECVDESLQTSEDPSDETVAALTGSLEGQLESGGSALPGTNIAATTINSLVLYVGMQACESAVSQHLPVFQRDSPHAKLLTKITPRLGTAARYFYLSAIVNHLRYPNAHTTFFSSLLLHIFDYASQETTDEIKQQITRVLLERLFVHRPHPWGLIVTILDLFKGAEHDFWNLSFIRSAPEIPRMFGSIVQMIGNSPSRQ